MDLKIFCIRAAKSLGRESDLDVKAEGDNNALNPNGRLKAPRRVFAAIMIMSLIHIT